MSIKVVIARISTGIQLHIMQEVIIPAVYICTSVAFCKPKPANSYL